MSIIDDLIYDRTAADVDAVKALRAKGLAGMSAAEIAEYLAGMKGSYNYMDLNRVGQALIYVAAELNANSFSVVVNPKTNWTITDIPTLAQMQQYLDDIAAIHDAVPMPTAAGSVPDSMAYLDYKKANDIERILYYADKIANDIIAIFLRSGVWNSGDANKYLIEADYGKYEPKSTQTLSGTIVSFVNYLPIPAIRVGIYGSDSDSGAIVNIPNALPLPALDVSI